MDSLRFEQQTGYSFQSWSPKVELTDWIIEASNHGDDWHSIDQRSDNWMIPGTVYCIGVTADGEWQFIRIR
jgi:hypothetical protein